MKELIEELKEQVKNLNYERDCSEYQRCMDIEFVFDLLLDIVEKQLDIVEKQEERIINLENRMNGIR